MNLTQLQKEAHAIAQDQGWYDTESTFGDQIARIHSGLSRALEAYRAQGIFPGEAADSGLFGEVAEELADMVIRVAEMAEHFEVWSDAAYQRASVGGYPLPQLETFGEWVTYVHYWASKAAWEYWLAQADDEEDIPYWADAVGEVIRGVVYIASHYDIDLDAAIAAKMEYYRTGPHRRVGKVL